MREVEKEEGRTRQQLSITLSPIAREQLEIMSNRSGISRSAVIEMALREIAFREEGGEQGGD